MAEYVLLADVGEFELGGFDAEFEFPQSLVLEADVGLFTIDTFDADLLAPDDSSQPTIEAVPATVGQVEDIPALVEHQQDKVGLTVGVSTSSPEEVFQGAVVFESDDDGATYTPIDRINGQAVVGNVDGTFAGGVSGRFWDTKNTLRVVLTKNDVELSSEDDELVAAGKVNTLLVGKEIIGFANASLVSSNPLTYDLSRLLRGRRNTEDWMDNHAQNERVMLLTPPSSIKFIETGLMSYGVQKTYKVVPAGLTVDDVTQTTIIRPSGQSMMQFAPELTESFRNADDDLTIRWSWRTKSRFRMFSGIRARLFDCGCCPRFEIDIWTAGFGEIIRTVCIDGDTEFVYTYEMQTIDFGSPQSSICIDIYMIGQSVGRGRVLREEV